MLNRIPQEEVRDLVRQIKDKTLSKERRVQAAKQLHLTVSQSISIEDLNNDWHDVLRDLSSVISVRNLNYEVKRSASEVCAAIGCLARSEYGWFLNWVKNEYLGCSVRAEEERALYIFMITETIRETIAKGELFEHDHVEAIMKMVIDFLDGNNSHIILVALLDLCLLISQCYPSVFHNHFEEVVDFTIGWLVESVPSSVAVKGREVLHELKLFWVDNLPYARQLISHFLEDVSSYVEDAVSLEEKTEDSLCRACAIVRSLCDVLESLVDISLSVEIGITHILQQVLNSCWDIVRFLGSLHNKNQLKLFSSFCPIFLAVVKVHDDSSIQSQKVLSSSLRIAVHLASCCRNNESATLVFVKMFTQVFSYSLPSSVLVELVHDLIGNDGPFSLLTLNHMASVELCSDLSKLVSTLLSPTSLPLLQKTFSIVRASIIHNIGILSCRENIFFLDGLRGAEKRLIIVLNSMTTIATLKNSLIVMMGLQPSLFSMLTQDIPFTESWFMMRHRSVYFAAMRVILLHVEAHDYFWGNSDWLSDGVRSVIMGESLTSRHVELQIIAITKKLEHNEGWQICSKMVGDWLYGLLMGIADSTMNRLSSKTEMKQLKVALAKRIMSGIRNQKIVDIAERLGVFQDCPVVESTISAARSLRTTIMDSEEAARFWCRMDKSMFIRAAVDIAGWDSLECGQIRIPNSSFCSNDFSVLSDFLLRGVIPSYQRDPKYDDNWIVDSVNLLHLKTRMGGASKSVGEKLNAAQNWKWAINQMAYHCIENRMKTSLGKPMETFNQIGGEIQRLAKEALGMLGPVDHSKYSELSAIIRVRDEEEEESYGEPRKLSASEEWWRVRCLLEFFAVLDKLIFQAHSGTSFFISNFSQLARQFFITNVTSCQEWLCRTYSSAMVVAYHNGYYAQVISFGSSALTDLEKLFHRAEYSAREKGDTSPVQPPSKAYAILGWMARAMAELGAAQSAEGLRMWARRVYKIDMKWLEGAALMASGRYERSLQSFRDCLSDDSLPDSAKVLIRGMCVDSLIRLRLPELVDAHNCPADLRLWSDEEVLAGSPPAGFDSETFERVKQLCSFAKVEKAKPPKVLWDLSQSMETSEIQLMQTLRRTDVQEMRDHLTVMGKNVLMFDSGLKIHGRISAIDRITSSVLTRMSKKSHQGDVNTSIINELSSEFLFDESLRLDDGERLWLSRRLSTWAERLGAFSHERQDAARLARKTENAHLTRDLLCKVIGSATFEKRVLTGLFVTSQRAKLLWKDSSFSEKVNAFMNVFMSVAEAFEVDSQNQRMLTMLNNPPMMGGVSDGSEFFPNGISNQGLRFDALKLNGLPATDNVMMAKTCVTLAGWLQEQPEIKDSLPQECRHTTLWSCLEGVERDSGGDTVLSFLTMATRMAPQLAKAHLKLANWTFEMAAGIEKERSIFERNYRVLLGQDVEQRVLDSLWNTITTSSSLLQLRKGVSSIAILTDNVSVNRLLDSNSHFLNLWTQIVSRKTILYSSAAREYFSFIAHSGVNSSSQIESDTVQGTVGTVSATLRILGLVVDNSELLHSCIDEGLESTNELLWKDILPQLFSRLSHPVRAVRESILKLLTRICRSSPHSMVFQVIAGTCSATLLTNHPDDVLDEERDEYDSVSQIDRSLMFESCRHLEQCLQQMYPSLVKDVREFVSELHKINLLYEERWIFVLSNLDREMSKRLDQIRAENQRTRSATHLDAKTKTDIIAKKTKLIVTSVFRILQDLYERTCEQPPVTLNERSFVDAYKDKLKTAFEVSKANKTNPEKAWTHFKQILGVLQQKKSRRAGCLLSLSHISNMLSSMKKSSVPIPGQEDKDYSKVVSIASLGGTIMVVPSKTRPKKISFTGTDGSVHHFLFKGQEDLHLDERIMQLLRICNLMMSGSAKRSWPSYAAHPYSVTPLGTRSGLIQWVGGATPIFLIYRKWQARQKELQELTKTKAAADSIQPVQGEIERPTDLYQKTLRLAFAKNNISPSTMADRANWPTSVLNGVLGTLIKETPKDLLSRELWIRAGGADTWWRVVSRLARSSAVMSMIGSILGLGDRHLDNLLINLDRGDIVHVDYNICFDRGRHLRVPETVPFRLTQNLVHAMGPTQIEGTFRESCAHVLSTLRSGRDILLTVLDAFVYDPLVDWAGSEHLTSTSAAVSMAVTLAVYGTDVRAVEAKPVAREMFAIRIEELHTPWMDNGTELSSALSNLISIFEKQGQEDANNAWQNTDVVDQERVEAGRRLKSAITEHHAIMKIFRPLLRALATCDERFVLFLRVYREKFSEPLIRGHQLLESDPTNLIECIKLFESVLANMNDIYSSLLDLNLTESVIVPSGSSSSDSWLGAPPGLEGMGERQEQEQNTHAKNVVRRVRARLEGKLEKTNSLKVYTPSEQADHLIRQATNRTLLSLMYEGWTAWV